MAKADNPLQEVQLRVQSLVSNVAASWSDLRNKGPANLQLQMPVIQMPAFRPEKKDGPKVKGLGKLMYKEDPPELMECYDLERQFDMEGAAGCYRQALDKHGQKNKVGREAKGRLSKQLSDMGWQCYSHSQKFPVVRTAKPQPGTYQQGGEFINEAMRVSDEVMKEHPNWARAHLATAVNYGRLALYSDNKTKVSLCDKVKEEAEEAIRLNPNDDMAWHCLGRWNYEVANVNPVVKVVMKHWYGGDISATYADAIHHYSKAAAIAPTRPHHQYELAKVQLKMGNRDTAIATMHKALEYEVEDINAELGRLHVLLMLEKLGKSKNVSTEKLFK
mmetsp:Transcript_25190/g.30495  ORF Transcript_25190/g.30495 Transcript_25190/m.30495 type:complete len:332 (+) Transcript_25190:416-1411(+)|eukprot:CAMPEP_0197845030 /NCGR_PEP_ID=MMETSP1438-20131217/1984_1 /TAXON_ID=1461541 /ORGANISM="Pterosperma sp., Strain CCMP1384" /LENGTH=331 /DNA_ID=CAMNT_0043456101 /DNA_START=412 /DNA_END=1407 /DNA_ORIENTATION=+